MVTSTDGSDTTKTLLKSLSQTPARTLSLRNYPYELYDLDIPGRSEKLNLAEIELVRDRERNLPRYYNDVRRQLLPLQMMVMSLSYSCLPILISNKSTLW